MEAYGLEVLFSWGSQKLKGHRFEAISFHLSTYLWELNGKLCKFFTKGEMINLKFMITYVEILVALLISQYFPVKTQ